MADHIRRNLLFSDFAGKLPVICVSGRITSLLRGMWGISKVRADNDLHHAKDAVVIACISQRMIGLITRYRQQRERARWQPGQKFVDTETGEIIDFKFSFPLPWSGFRKELDARLLDDPEAALAVLNLPSYADGMVPPAVFVSRKSDRKASGPLHKETIRSLRQYPDGTKKVVSRIQLTDLKLSDLDRLYAPETNEKLYAAIKERLIACGGNAKKAFEDTPLRKPTKDGIPGPIVRAVKVAETNFSGVQIRPSRPRRVELPDIQITNTLDVQLRTGLAGNGGMVRIDIFQKEQKFYVVPIYTLDIAARKLPNKAIVQGVEEDHWIKIDDTFDFVYSLHSYELVKIVDSKGIDRFGYYSKCNRSTGAIDITCPNTSKVIPSIGMRTIKSIQKFEVGILGDYHPVSKETRRGMANGRDRESREAVGQE
jgi:CRISPR-associated endonuclease Csn1